MLESQISQQQSIYLCHDLENKGRTTAISKRKKMEQLCVPKKEKEKKIEQEPCSQTKEIRQP